MSDTLSLGASDSNGHAPPVGGTFGAMNTIYTSVSARVNAIVNTTMNSTNFTRVFTTVIGVGIFIDTINIIIKIKIRNYKNDGFYDGFYENDGFYAKLYWNNDFCDYL